jgi:hypothetical protein
VYADLNCAGGRAETKARGSWCGARAGGAGPVCPADLSRCGPERLKKLFQGA